MMIKDQAANIALFPKELRRILVQDIRHSNRHSNCLFLELTVAMGSPLWLNRTARRLLPIQNARTIISPNIMNNQISEERKLTMHSPHPKIAFERVEITIAYGIAALPPVDCSPKWRVVLAFASRKEGTVSDPNV